MSFETFRILYLLGSILAGAIAFWLMRKSRDDVIVLAFMSFMMFAIFFTQYLDSGKGVSTDDIAEFLFRALTHVRGDFILVVCNTLLWGVVPFTFALRLSKKRFGQWLVWLVFLFFSVVKTIFDDRLLIHQYPQEIFHSFEWGYVLVAWLIVYSIATLFITKGVARFKDLKI